MRIIGIDPGLAAMGYGVIDWDGNIAQAVTSGTITTSAKKPLVERLAYLNQQLGEIIKQTKPELSAFETVVYCKNIKTALLLGQARGALLVALAEQQIPMYEFSPLEIKQSVVGAGRASKEQVQKMIQFLLRLDQLPETEHIADAFAAAICCAHSYKHRARIKDKL